MLVETVLLLNSFCVLTLFQVEIFAFALDPVSVALALLSEGYKGQSGNLNAEESSTTATLCTSVIEVEDPSTNQLLMYRSELVFGKDRTYLSTTCFHCPIHHPPRCC